MGRKLTILIVALVTAVVATPLRAQQSRPRLIVLLVVDQFRGDYVDKFRQQWTGGLHRLLTDGAWFRQVDYTYVNTVTCSGHATIGTGTLPSTHGMVMNTWWDRQRHTEVPCTRDTATTGSAVRRSPQASPGVLDVYMRDRIEAHQFEDNPMAGASPRATIANEVAT